MTDNNKNFRVKNGLDVGNISINQNNEIISTTPSDIDLYTNNWAGDGVEVWLRHNDQVQINTANGVYSWRFTKDGNHPHKEAIEQIVPISCGDNI